MFTAIFMEHQQLTFVFMTGFYQFCKGTKRNLRTSDFSQQEE